MHEPSAHFSSTTTRASRTAGAASLHEGHASHWTVPPSPSVIAQALPIADVIHVLDLFPVMEPPVARFVWDEHGKDASGGPRRETTTHGRIRAIDFVTDTRKAMATAPARASFFQGVELHSILPSLLIKLVVHWPYQTVGPLHVLSRFRHEFARAKVAVFPVCSV